MKITYLSHGKIETGGYKHEKTLTEAIADSVNNCSSCFKEIRFNKNFKGIFQWVFLFYKSFISAKGDVIITVSRLAWPTIVRNVFNKNKIIVVIHNYDITDGKPRLYFVLLKQFIRFIGKRKNKYAVIIISQYWKSFFENTFAANCNLFVFPNLADCSKLNFYRDVIGRKSKMIHLGQWNDKIDKKAYRILIHKMNKAGIACYFSDNTGAEVADFPVSFFQTYEGYLKQMALSEATVILNKINEGWNRVAHESFLTGTQVIAFSKGGIAELVQKGNGYLVNSAEEAFEIIQKGQFKKIDEITLQEYDISQKQKFVIPITNWIKEL